MAKKKAAAAASDRGAPQKECPKCHATMHARKGKCDGCGYEFPAAASKPTSTGSRSKGDSEKEAMQFVLFNQGGNIEKAIKAVEGYAADDLAAFIAKCGGVEKAKAALAGLKEKAK
jgi:DNA-directed RNA polymerase subunit M/transcription elongation factor TFIIS